MKKQSPNEHQHSEKELQTLLPPTLTQPKDTEFYNSQYADITVNAEQIRKSERILLYRINETAAVKQTKLTPAQQAQARYEARERKYHDTVITTAYWNRVFRSDVAIPKYTAAQMAVLMQHKFETEKQKPMLLQPNSSNERIFKLLCLYFTGDAAFETFGYTNSQQQFVPYSLNKGIMLTGPVGCGKTSMMRIFTINQQATYAVKSCLQVAESYVNEDKDNKRDILEYYSQLLKTPTNSNIFRHTAIGICFDDLGIEDVRSKFGNQTNVLAYILTRRYDVVPFNYTHITTNLGIADIEKFYGSRLRSRMIEMFNPITFNINDPDFRQTQTTKTTTV